ncbi:PRD domain-containing protein [Gephyromycinifex aptenodytis]|uniref:PRD domain-containing protein n=1 Tax=Gephyromycinifex aptenodytis TaxID=2716227 RepID=UPI001445CFB8|nr:PRD domain-containing protein [Gephyromycinifex aptenodytis]
MQVVRVLNNNAVLAQRNDGTRVVLMGKGLGFGRHLGDPVDVASVTQTFVPDGEHSIGRLAGLLGDLPLEITETAGRIVGAYRRRTGLEPTQALLLAVADHLSVAVRHRDHEAAAYPLAWEVAQLFPEELAAGREALDIIASDHDVRLPPEEATAFALHFVNAQVAGRNMAHTVAMTHRIRQVLSVVAAAFDTALDDQSMSVARFVTHLRYLFVRLAQQGQVTQAPALLIESIRTAHPNSWRVAERLQGVLVMDGHHLNEAELSYLTLHVARLATDVGVAT